MTKNFFVLYISSRGLQSGFSVQGIMMSDVQKAICASLTPMPLYIRVVTIFSITNGSPIAQYSVGTQVFGDFIASDIVMSQQK
jgi:hypothetical protein